MEIDQLVFVKLSFEPVYSNIVWIIFRGFLCESEILAIEMYQIDII